jgi:hypothetical protein
MPATRTHSPAPVPGGLLIRADNVPLTVEAAEDSGKPNLRRFSMVAYTGGAMALGGWPHPVVVDLAGLQVGRKSRPILKDHDAGRIVGHTETVAVEGNRLKVDGVISGVGDAAREIIGASDNGFPWQASLGAAVRRVVFVPEGKTAQANGQRFRGPVYIVRQARLGEISFVALGADDDTSARVEAAQCAVTNQHTEVMSMEFEQWLAAKGFALADLSEEQSTSLRAMHEGEHAEGGDVDAAARR